VRDERAGESEGEELGAEAQRMLNRTDIDHMLDRGCCCKGCIAKFDDDERGCLSQFNISDVVDLREPLLHFSRMERRIYHAQNESVRAHAQRVQEEGSAAMRSKLFILNDGKQRRVCVAGFKALMHINKPETWRDILCDARSERPRAHEVRS